MTASKSRYYNRRAYRYGLLHYCAMSKLYMGNIKEREDVKDTLSPDDIRMILALIDLMFIDEDQSKVIPS